MPGPGQSGPRIRASGLARAGALGTMCGMTARLRLPAALIALISGPVAFAQTPLDAEAFDALTRGRTMLFFSEGAPYGVERYMAGRRVSWSFLDGECKEGQWYPQGDMICFLYDSYPDPQCWTFFADGSGLLAMFEDGLDTSDGYSARETDEPLICPGPKIGV